MRVVGVTSPQPASGVSSVCRRICEAVARSGTRTLLVDLSGKPEVGPVTTVWYPGVGGAGQSIRRVSAGYDCVVATFDKDSRFLFNNIERLRRSLAEEFPSYEAIIVDIPSVPSADPAGLNGAAAAAACDGVLLICVSCEVSREQLNESLDAMANVEANLVGVVLNDIRNPTLGAEFAREARRMRRYLPRLSGWLERKALSSVILN